MSGGLGMWSQGRQFETGGDLLSSEDREMRLKGLLRRGKGATAFPLTSFRAGRFSLIAHRWLGQRRYGMYSPRRV